jgi:inosine/xanthosine triphosphatase
MIEYIFVGSTNPVKTNAVVNAVTDQWPAAKIQGFETESGVSHQPRGDEETRQGATNRAHAALADGQKWLAEQNLRSDQILGVGLEGGVFDQPNEELWSTVWIVVVDPKGNTAAANGARFQVPEIVAQQIRAGGEMGPIMSELVGTADIRKKQGMIGIITNDFVHRTEEYTGITKLAIGLWYGRDWQEQLKK